MTLTKSFESSIFVTNDVNSIPKYFFLKPPIYLDLLYFFYLFDIINIT